MSKEVLERARDIVANKWHKGSFTDRKGGYCALGALGMARHNLPSVCSRADSDYLAQHLADVGWRGGDGCDSACCDGCIDIAHFNDDENTTQELVLQLFDKAIADL